MGMKPEPIARIVVKDLQTKKSKTTTLYKNSITSIKQIHKKIREAFE